MNDKDRTPPLVSACLLLLALLLVTACQGEVAAGVDGGSPGPIACKHAFDCAGKPGCAAGCVCSPALGCKPKLSCTLSTEQKDCGVGGLCHGGTCIPVPTCVAQKDCAPYGLQCNLQFHLCGRTGSCSKHSDCKPPVNYCNPSSKLCVAPTCLNGGVTCTSPKSKCSNQGTCIAPSPPPAGSCAADADCCPEDKDKNQSCAKGAMEHCEIPKGAAKGTCKPGCNSARRLA